MNRTPFVIMQSNSGIKAPCDRKSRSLLIWEDKGSGSCVSMNSNLNFDLCTGFAAPRNWTNRAKWSSLKKASETEWVQFHGGMWSLNNLARRKRRHSCCSNLDGGRPTDWLADWLEEREKNSKHLLDWFSPTELSWMRGVNGGSLDWKLLKILSRHHKKCAGGGRAARGPAC